MKTSDPFSLVTSLSEEVVDLPIIRNQGKLRVSQTCCSKTSW